MVEDSRTLHIFHLLFVSHITQKQYNTSCTHQTDDEVSKYCLSEVSLRLVDVNENKEITVSKTIEGELGNVTKQQLIGLNGVMENYVT